MISSTATGADAGGSSVCNVVLFLLRPERLGLLLQTLMLAPFFVVQCCPQCAMLSSVCNVVLFLLRPERFGLLLQTLMLVPFLSVQCCPQCAMLSSVCNADLSVQCCPQCAMLTSVCNVVLFLLRYELSRLLLQTQSLVEVCNVVFFSDLSSPDFCYRP